MTTLAHGIAAIRAAAAGMPAAPGVYRMLGADGAALYIGKARALSRRVASYAANAARLPVRLQRMIAAVAAVDALHTRTEAEALLLESNLIKREKPRFNILLRDDKSFPYILARADHPFGQLVKHRGARDEARGRYYGPFPGAGDVARTITALQKAFLIRNCADAVFAGRSRPCLQYHIRRCTAPCVGYVTQDQYAGQMAQARAFLEGRSQEVQRALADAMEAAAATMEYEAAAGYRDRLRALAAITARQDVDLAGIGDADAFALAGAGAGRCVYALFARGGRVLGGRAYAPRCAADDTDGAVLAAFIAQFYAGKPIPPEVIAAPAPDEADILAQALSARAGRRVRLSSAPRRGPRRAFADLAARNADEALRRGLSDRAADAAGLAGLAALLSLPAPPERVEVYDNSHTAGREAVGAMIAAGPEGFIKKAYRKFTLRAAAPGDDYAAMAEVLARRLKGPPEGWPDAIILDGGAGQLSAGARALERAGAAGRIALMAVAKGPERNAGTERLFVPNAPPPSRASPVIPPPEGAPLKIPPPEGGALKIPPPGGGALKIHPPEGGALKIPPPVRGGLGGGHGEGHSAPARDRTHRVLTLPPNDPVLHYIQRLRDEAHRFAIAAHRARRQKGVETSGLEGIPGVGPARRRALLRRFGSARAVADAAPEDLARVEGISRALAARIAAACADGAPA
jgi:excinuclease ABC subunit C